MERSCCPAALAPFASKNVLYLPTDSLEASNLSQFFLLLPMKLGLSGKALLTVGRRDVSRLSAGDISPRGRATIHTIQCRIVRRVLTPATRGTLPAQGPIPLSEISLKSSRTTIPTFELLQNARLLVHRKPRSHHHCLGSIQFLRYIERIRRQSNFHSWDYSVCPLVQ
jgi:hypothetical protein